MAHTLFPHQERALEWAMPRNQIALFMEMRLGKSVVSIRWAKSRNPKKVLIVGPLTCLPDWELELEEEGIENVNWLLGSGNDRLAKAKASNGWFLINFEGVRTCPAIADLNWDVVIVDESTRIRNAKAQTTKTFTRGFERTEYKAILSGLPAPEDPGDLFSQFQFLKGRFMGFNNYWAFQQKLFRQGFGGFGWIPKPGTISRVRKAAHQDAFFLTRKEVGIGGKKLYERRTVEMNAAQRLAYRDIKKDFKFGELMTKWVTTQHLWMQRVAGGFSPDRMNPEYISDAKVKESVGLMKEELKGQPVVFWFRFNEELAAVYHTFKREKISVSGITGATPIELRKQRIRSFQAGNVDAMCMQIKCGKYGLNASIADTEVYYSNYYDLEDRMQSEDRIVHAKKTTPLLVLDLVTKKSADEAVQKALKFKRLGARMFDNKLGEYLVSHLKETA